MPDTHPAAAYFVESLRASAYAIAAASTGNLRASAAHAKAAAAWLTTLVAATAALAAAEAAAGPAAAPIIRAAFREWIERGMADHHASLRAADDPRAN